MIQVGQGLGEREASLVQCYCPPEDLTGDLVRSLGVILDYTGHQIQPFIVVA